MLIFVNIARYFHKLINLTVNTTGWSWGMEGGAISWSSGVAGEALGCTTCSDARVDGIAEDVTTSMLSTTLGGMMGEGMDWSGRSSDVRR